MAGITDNTFRTLCFEQGAQLCFTEMISASGLKYENANTFALLKTTVPCGVQLFGKEPELLAPMGEQLCQRDDVLCIDINMGCPAPKIVKNGEGSALMKDIPLAKQIIGSVRKRVHKPLSVKFRSGWDAQSVNAVEFAKMCEDSGCDFITIHGRTRQQYYAGRADLDVIAQVKQAVRIPVYGNGDIFCAKDALHMLNYTGCDGVMVARGAMGNPFIFKEIHCALKGEPYTPPSRTQRMETALRQLKLMAEEKGEYRAVREFRTHSPHYLKGMDGAAKLRRELNIADSVEKVEELLTSIG